MSQFRSPLAAKGPRPVKTAEDRPVVVPFTPPITSVPFEIERDARSTDELSISIQKRSEVHTEQLVRQPEKHTDHLQGMSGIAVAKPTRQLTRPLTGTLISMDSSAGVAAGKKTVVIPGNRKRAATTVQLEPAIKRRLPHKVRYSIILSAIFGFVGFSLLSLTPLNDAGSHIPVIGNAIKWVHTQQQSWDLAIHSDGANQTADTTTNNGGDTGPTITYLPTSKYMAIAQQDAINAGIPPTYFVNQIQAESSFNPNAVSPVGAIGIAQFMPTTAAEMGINPWDPVQALEGAARYMATYYHQYGNDYAKALAAYNAGPGVVDALVSQYGSYWMYHLPLETRNYIYKIMGI